MMLAGLLASAPLLQAAPSRGVVVDQVDCIEVNHFFDEHGKRVFDQCIFYDWDSDAGRYQVRAWRLLKTQDQWPLKDHRRGDYVAVWMDGDTLREVRAAAVRETFSTYDPELAEREFLPKEQRRELSRPLKKKPAVIIPSHSDPE
jgi:hypothetical protein